MAELQSSEGVSAGQQSKIHSIASLLLDDFLQAQHSFELSQYIEQLNAPHLHSLLVAKILNLSLDRHEELRSRVPELLASLYTRNSITAESLESGFEQFTSEIPDVVVDVPRAVELYGEFVAQSLENKCLPEGFLACIPKLMNNDLMAKQAIAKIHDLIALPLPITVVKKRSVGIFEELFSSGDIDDAVACVNDLDAPPLIHEVVKRGVSMAMDRKERERELVSKLLVALVASKLCSEDQIMEGFVRMLVRLDDMTIDTPDAPTILANFIARAIVDEVVPPSFFQLIPPSLIAAGKGEVVANTVKALIHKNHAAQRLAGIWGAARFQSVDELKQQIALIVEEYLSCGDINEAIRCINEINVPLFLHEFVKRLVVLSLGADEKHQEAAVSLLVCMTRSSHLSHRQLHQGFLRVVGELDDLSLDIPQAALRLSKMTDTLMSVGCLSITFRSHVWGSRARAGSLNRVLALASLILDEFALIDDTAEAALSFLELRSPHLHGEVVAKLMRDSMDGNEHKQDLCGKLVSALHVRGVFTTPDIEKGMELLLTNLNDIILDVPNAEDIFAKFIAKMVVDRCIPEQFITNLKNGDGIVDRDAADRIHHKVTTTIALPLPITVAKNASKAALDDLFESGDVAGCVTQLGEIKMTLYGHEVVRIAITTALEHHEKERELISQLLAQLGGSGITRQDQLMEGFVRILARLPDLKLDTPHAPKLVGNFLARAIWDEIVPKNFLQLIPASLVTEGESAEAIKIATLSVEQRHAGTRIGAIWGPAAGKSTEELKTFIQQTILEFLDTGDTNEAVRCIKELNVPMFAHEVIRSTLQLLIERRKGEQEAYKGVSLIVALQKQQVIDIKAITKGINRALLELADLSIDVPDAKVQMKNLMSKFQAASLLEESVIPALEAAT